MRDTIDMAREAGLRSAVLLAHFKSWDALCDSEQDEFDRLVSFAELVRADEREACAKDFEAEADTWAAWPQAGAAKRIGAAAIRARGETK